jgi:Domain of unknown function (DUF4249)
MKKLLLFAALYFIALQFSCTNDFEVNAKWKDIPIVYALLDISDSAHYIRLEKAFLTDDEDATQVAKIADSIYYEDATVMLERVSNGQLFTLQKVDGNKWGYPREEGSFATDPNWLYRIDSAEIMLKANEQYRLRIDRGNGLPEVTSQTLVLAPIKLNTPSASTQGFSFNGNGVSKTNVAFDATDSATIFDVNLYIQYVEFPASNPSEQELKTIVWPWARGLRRESSANSFKIERPGAEFYEIMKNSIEVNDLLKRIFLGIDVEVIAGDNSLENYVNVSLANSGITASQEIPTYTNMSEGLGIFAGINKFKRYSVGLVQSTRDSLKEGYRTKQLNFF